LSDIADAFCVVRACIASIFRLHCLYTLSKSGDFFWDDPGTATWSIIELNVGIICASISTLRPLLSLFLPRVFGSKHSYKRQTPPPYLNDSKMRPRMEIVAGQQNEIGDTTSDEMILRHGQTDLGKLSGREMASKEDNWPIRVYTEFDLQEERKQSV
jgi:hypothetical protein